MRNVRRGAGGPAGLAQARTRNPRAKLCAFVIVPVPVLRADERRRLAQRVPHLQEQPRFTGHLAFDVQQVPRRVDFIHKDALHGPFPVPHSPRHLLAFPHPPGVLRVPDRAVRAVLLRSAVRRGQPGEAPALHRALEPLADGEPAHVHVLPRDEVRRAEHRAHRQQRVLRDAELRHFAFQRNALRLEVPAKRGGELLRLFRTGAHLQGKHAGGGFIQLPLRHLREEAHRACRIGPCRRVFVHRRHASACVLNAWAFEDASRFAFRVDDDRR